MKTVAAALLNEGTEYLLSGRMEDAENKFRESMALCETSAVLHNNLGFLLMQKEQFDASEREYLRAIELDPAYATAYTNLGIACLMMQRWEDARRYLLQALSLDENDFHANESLAQLLMLQGNPAASEYYWRKAYYLQPKSGILINLAQTLLEQQLVDEALEVLQLTGNDQWENVRYHALLGAIQYMKFDFGAAIKSFKQALGFEPENIEVRHNLGLALLATGQGQEAMQEFNRILLLQPDNLEARNNLAVLELASGAFDTALRHFDMVLAQEPLNAKALYYKALLHFRQKDLSQSVKLLNKIMETDRQEYGQKAKELLVEIQSNKAGDHENK